MNEVMGAKRLLFLGQQVLTRGHDSSCITECELEMTVMGDSKRNQNLPDIIQKKEMTA